jgi:hypothetical protein
VRTCVGGAEKEGREEGMEEGEEGAEEKGEMIQIFVRNIFMNVSSFVLLPMLSMTETVRRSENQRIK